MSSLENKLLWVVPGKRFWVWLLLLMGLFRVEGAQWGKVPALLPMPQMVSWNATRFPVPSNGQWLKQKLVSKLPGITFHENEAYSLVINADSAVLLAITDEGLFRGLQTVNQLMYVEHGQRYVAGCSISDWPAFKIRGFMQDVGRNYLPLSLLKEQIDVMAAYKYNFFHLHVTDNPGWRLESKRYPQLTRSGTMSRWPGKYYSREEFLELVDYCKKRFITLVPELDVPGHCAAFRNAFSLDSMSDPQVQPILLGLVDELCELVPKEEMPYLHLGTDEVWQKKEKAAPGVLAALVARAGMHGREVILWRPGQTIEGDTLSVSQLWSSAGKPRDGHRYLDSRLNYLNHLDPLAGIAQLYFDRICNKPKGDSLALGGVLCCWNDNNVNQPSDILAQNPLYPGMLTYSETTWKGQPADFGDQFLAKLPGRENPLYDQFASFEERLTSHRDLYFQGKPFPYVRQSEIVWSLAGPYDKDKDRALIGKIEESRCNIPMEVDGVAWKAPCMGGTLHINHFFGYPSYITAKKGIVYATSQLWSPENQEVDCWIGFHDWSRSGGRRGGPFPNPGQWHNTDAKIWVNGKEIAPPVWNHPGLQAKSEEIPFTDENYFFRKPTKISLKKGWNRILLKVPGEEKGWKWMFTFVPVRFQNGNPSEVPFLRFSAHTEKAENQFKMGLPFGEHMVFQQGKKIEIFGEAGRRDHLHLVFGKNEVDCQADETGRWKAVLPQMTAGGPYPLSVDRNGYPEVRWKDILVGDVWFCSGQSNMEFALSQAEGGKLEASRSADRQLRLFHYKAVAPTYDRAWDSLTLSKVNHFNYFEGSWQPSAPENAASFSAIAYGFGEVLRKALGVPVGLIEVAAGGAPGESFVDQSTLKSDPRLVNLLSAWYDNPLVMQWCRERAQKNCEAANLLMQRHPYMPAYLYEAGIAPFTKFPIKGVIWYQGESNVENSALYELIFPGLIQCWRRSWSDPDLPFIFAQLSSIQRPGWEIFRDSQRRMAATIPGTGMVITADLGDSLNVHPVRKMAVANRFALQALQKAYGRNIQADGPLPLKSVKTGRGIEISFDHASGLKTADSKPVRELEIATADTVFYPTHGSILGDKIIIDTKDQDIKFVRYGWRPFSRGNLINGNGLPASTFCIITH